MAHLQKIIPHYTYEDYLHWEGRWELIDGHPIAMSPSPMPRHQKLVISFAAELLRIIKKCKHCTVYDYLDYKVEDDTILQPDILVVCKEIKKSYLDFAPSLVTEILSPSTALRDRHTKFEIYEQQGIKYYVIIDPDKDIVEVYSLQNGKYILDNEKKNNFDFLFDENCGGIINFEEIW